MATCTRSVLRVLTGCQRQLRGSALIGMSQKHGPIRTFAAVRFMKKEKKEEEGEKAMKKEKKVIDDTGRHKPFGKTAWAPVDDVYVMRFYPRTLYAVEDAIDLLKSFQALDFTPKNQAVYMDLKLNMKLEKKRRIDPFISTVHLPNPFKTGMNTVLLFTEDEGQVKVAQENGAMLAGGAELVQPILDGDISADFYIAVPEILPKLLPLKNKLRKKFPKSKRGSVGVNIPQMLNLFKMGHEYKVEEDCYIRTQIATLDMDKQQIQENLETIMKDVCSHRPADKGPFIERAIVASHTSEALWFRSDDVLQK